MELLNAGLIHSPTVEVGVTVAVPNFQMSSAFTSADFEQIVETVMQREGAGSESGVRNSVFLAVHRPMIFST